MQSLSTALLKLGQVSNATEYQEAILDRISVIEDVCDQLRELGQNAKQDYDKTKRAPLLNMSEMANSIADQVYSFLDIEKYVPMTASRKRAG